MSRLDERMAMLEAENDNLRQKVALLEGMLQELKNNRQIPKRTSWNVPHWVVDSCEK